MHIRLLSILTLAAFALAGCGDAPPSGTLASAGYVPPANGTSTNSYQDFEDPLAPPAAPPGSNPLQCIQDQIPATPPEDRCKYAFSRYVVHFMELPSPGTGTYEVYLANATGEASRLGELPALEGPMFEAEFNVTNENLAGHFEFVQVRLGEFILAEAPTTDGLQPFTLAPSARALQVEGSYRGKELTVQISGLPDNVTFTGRLYTAEGVATATAAATFPVGNGETVFMAEENLANFAEFHVHVGDSMVNLYKSPLGA